jgi:hypothetical protein
VDGISRGATLTGPPVQTGQTVSRSPEIMPRGFAPFRVCRRSCHSMALAAVSTAAASGAPVSAVWALRRAKSGESDREPGHWGEGWVNHPSLHKVPRVPDFGLAYCPTPPNCSCRSPDCASGGHSILSLR